MSLWSNIWGEMALGIVYGRVHGEAMNPKMFEHAKGLHDYIKKSMVQHVVELLQRNGMVITLCLPKEKEHCIKITGQVTEWVADKLIEDEKLNIK